RVESLKRRPAQFQSRRAGLRRLDFDVRPSDISRPTRSESLESGLFGCEATCVMNRARIARFAISLLVRSKNSVDESRPVPLNRRFYARNFYDIDPQSDYHTLSIHREI